jgi:L-asparaginase II
MVRVPSSALLVRVTRGGALESSHHGALAVVEGESLVRTRGDVGRLVFYRSTMKPMQAIPLVASGAADRFGLTAAELALAAGSHSGAAEHVEGTRSILRKAGLDESALCCGGHWSGVPEVHLQQRAVSETPLAVFSNCSGKHAGMLATARHMGLPTEGYLRPDHPLQQEILSRVAECAGVPVAEVLTAVDGCGAPTFAVPLAAVARSFARLADPSALPEPSAAALRRITRAMCDHPEMVAGRWRFDTDLMLAGKGRLVAKAGAEGVHAVVVPDRRLGMAVKVDDGSDRGYRIVVVEMLRSLGILGDADADLLLDKHAPRVVRNWAGDPVGTLEAVLG